jgi:CRP-like cAMP-binding protein
VLRKDKKIELLRATPLFAKCNKRQLSAVASSADLVDVPAGTRLVAEGRSDREFMVIIEGAVDVLRAGETINRLRSGDFFGEIA